jgi:hypothetical protein
VFWSPESCIGWRQLLGLNIQHQKDKSVEVESRHEKQRVDGFVVMSCRGGDGMGCLFNTAAS